MKTIIQCFLLIVFFFFVVQKLRTFLSSKKQDRLDREIDNDLQEEFTLAQNPEEFLNWVEEIQFDHDVSQKNR